MIEEIEACDSTMEILLQYQADLLIEEFKWADSIRLIERCNIFQDFIQTMKSTPQMLDENDENEHQVLRNLAKLLQEIQEYVEEFMKRFHYQGMTEPSYRQGCATDFAKLNQKIIRIGEELNVIDDEIDYDSRRSEDFEDQRNSFKSAFVRTLDEICLSDSSKYEENFQNLKKNIDTFPYSIAKFLALNKHMALTIAETKLIKSDMEWMLTQWEERFQPIERSHSNNTDSPADSSEVNSDNTNFRQRFDDNSMDTDFVHKLVENEHDRLNRDQVSIRLKLLSELKLPQEDILISSLKIGQGGFGEVFLGNYKKRFKVAIKTIRTLDDPQADIKRRSIENELLLMKYLGAYPTILSCYGYVMNGSSIQIVLELAPYGSLDKILRDFNTTPTFPISLTMAWLCDLADAIKFLHSKNIKHRDIKAENMLVFENLTIKLCDFGPAKHHLNNITAESRVGTFCFMAPEIRVGKVSDLSSDIFSFAMTAIQIISRKNPRIDNFKGQISETLAHVEISDESVIKRLTVLFNACVAYDPIVSSDKLRPSSTVVAEELTQILDEELGGDPRDEGHSLFQTIQTIELHVKKRQVDRHQQQRQHQQQQQQQHHQQQQVTNSTNNSRYSLFRPQNGHVSQQMKLLQQNFLLQNTQSTAVPHSTNHSTLSRSGSTNSLNAFSSNESYTNYSMMSSSKPTQENLTAMGYASIYPNLHSNTLLTSYSAASNTNLHNNHQQNNNHQSNNVPMLIPEADDKAELARFLHLEIGCEQSSAQQIATILVRTGILTFDILGRRLRRNPDLLLDLGIEEDIAHVIFEYFAQNDAGSIIPASQHGMMMMMMRPGSSSFSNSNSMMNLHRSSSNLSQVHSLPNRSSSYISTGSSYMLSMHGAEGKLPSEISRIYYEAAQCNNQEALNQLREAVLQGSKLAECFLMRMYALGLGGLNQDLELAKEMGTRLFPWLQEAVVRMGGHHDLATMYIKYLIGVCYSEGLGVPTDKKESVRWYKQSADEGYAAAQAYLGSCYFSGIGTNKSHVEAVKYYKLAAEQGYAGAQCNLGLCYEQGIGTKAEAKEAIRWYKASADQGDAAGLYNLGFCYQRGLGVELNLEQAFHYYIESATRGYTVAQYNVGVCYYFGQGTEQKIDEAVKWFHLSATKGYAPAQCKLGLCYENGHGIQQDYFQAISWYRQSAEKGDAAALYYLGFCYFSGIGVEKDHEEAVKYYKLSAAKNYPPAHNNLGFAYFNGLGVAVNYALAVKHYKIAADYGYAPALYNMGYCHEHGYGVGKKLNMVLRYYRLAAENGSVKAQNALSRYQF